ncbi:MAG: sigma 54-interacting transcriptional regulator [Chitinophagales bacterium]|nr:sigma 54-interacting transcriptional regulator [Hyphomicrobiales bacterium]
MSGCIRPINCAAIPRGAIKAEFLGDLNGAFTEVDAARENMFMHACDGTLFPR